MYRSDLQSILIDRSNICFGMTSQTNNFSNQQLLKSTVSQVDGFSDQLQSTLSVGSGRLAFHKTVIGREARAVHDRYDRRSECFLNEASGFG